MIDEMLGRLEASTVKFDIGRGGLVELTPQDIAAALGMCEDKFAAAIFHAAAGGTISNWQALDQMLANVQFAEWRRRADRLITAQLAEVEAAMMPHGYRKDAMDHARLMMEGARAAMWPQLIEKTYRAIRTAVIAEVRSSRVCTVCNGRGAVQVDTSIARCSNCLGSGKVAINDTSRAEAIDVDKSNYSRAWKQVYEWLLREVFDAIPRGRRQFSEAMERVLA
jgi:hypothetical protein